MLLVEGEEGRDSRSTKPRVNPAPTWRVTEMILPVKRRMPFWEARRSRMGSSFWERERAIERPIVHAFHTGVSQVLLGEKEAGVFTP